MPGGCNGTKSSNKKNSEEIGAKREKKRLSQHLAQRLPVTGASQY
jgi:hypothetical protein